MSSPEIIKAQLHGLQGYINGIIKSIQREGKQENPKKKSSKRPAPNRPIPVSEYICQNCGMHVEFCHQHTQKECTAYQSDLTNPDWRALKPILPARNNPKIRLPYYFEREEASEL